MGNGSQRHCLGWPTSGGTAAVVGFFKRIQQLRGSCTEGRTGMHRVTRDRHLPQPTALKSGQILGGVIGPHSRHNKGGEKA